MAAGLAQGQDAGLGERRGGAATAGAAEGPHIGRGIGHVDDEAVEGHGPHAAVERPGRGGLALQLDDLLGQEPHGGDAQAFAGLAQGRPSRRAAFAEGLEPSEDLAVAVAAEQAQGDHEPDHEPGRQPRAVGAVVSGSGEDFFHAGAGDDTFQGAETLTSGPGCASVGLLGIVPKRKFGT